MPEALNRLRRYALRAFECLLPEMREGDLELMFDRSGAALLWKTDTGGGMQLGLAAKDLPEEPTASDLQKLAQFLRDGDLHRRSECSERGPVAVDGIVRAAMNAMGAFDTPEVWYRGQPSTQMHLCPSVFRTTDTASEESGLLTGFVVGARSRHSHCPADDDHASWLTLMQHYGLPTRLLDWSESILIAAYFAVADRSFDSEHGIIWALSPGQLNESQLGLSRQICYIRAEQVQPLLAGAFARGSKPIDKAVAVSAPELDVRLLLQQGRFSLHGSALPLEQYPDAKRYLRRFTLPAFAKPSIRGQLDALGIRASTLFPDLGSLARDIREKCPKHRTEPAPPSTDSSGTTEAVST